MDIQEIGPSYPRHTVPHQKLRFIPSSIQPLSLSRPIIPDNRIHRIPHAKKYAMRSKILEHNSAVPYKRNMTIISPLNQLSRKSLLELEVIVDDIENLNLLSSLAKSLKKLTNLKKLTLKLTSYGILSLPGIKGLVWSLSHLKSLGSLCLHLPYHPRFKDKDFLHALRPFAKIKGLERLNLVVNVRHGIKSNIIGKLNDSLARIKPLTDINLNLALNEFIYRVKPAILSKMLERRLDYFNSDKMKFSFDVPYSMERKEILKTLDHIAFFQNLRCLNINFSSFVHRIDGMIDDELMSHLLPILSNHRQQLVRLSLSFEMSWYLDEPHIKDLLRSISKIKGLTALRLNLSSCFGVTDQVLYSTAKYLCRLPALELVSLSYDSCHQINDIGVRVLVMSLAKIRTLKQVDLVLSRCYKLTPKTAEPFALFESLTALSVNFENCSLMNESTVHYLAQALNKLKNLETVNLNLGYIKSITNYELCVLGTAISGLTDLKYLCVEIGGYRELTESAFVNFFRKLAGLKKIQGLSLNLRYNAQLTDRAIGVLCIIICGFNKLGELKLDLIGAEMLTELCYPKLVRVYAKFEDSKKVEIMI